MVILTEKIKQKALSLGFHKVGITSAINPEESIKHLQEWLTLGYHGEMAWMNNPKRFDIQQALTDVKSVICVALNYYTPHQHSENPEHGKISRYGWGRDYHKIMHKKLKTFSHWLEEQEEGITTKYYADTGPIADKVFAQKAGLGWIAKNGNLITREYGSWVFLGEILTNLSLTPDQPHTNHCGTCTRCLNACPTQAIVKPFVVDANQCIAYHTIENRAETLPENIASTVNNWVAGCDICQDVCPWNQRFAQETDISDFQPYPHNLAPKLTELAQLSEEDWDHRFRGSALRRIKPQMWRRNAKTAMDNAKESIVN
jgi:epoxyqueuosine reductase